MKMVHFLKQIATTALCSLYSYHIGMGLQEYVVS